ncbi:trans-aconitate 2-methyltransferase [Thalassotalea maritima]|uniref:class I SAM-dependent methyltransferase n=1 Tax=Thalassotalea maritima TaxID=3242416 RepID=UPI00352781ED
MDSYQITASTFNKLANRYQAKYMDFDFYLDTYDAFCDLVDTPHAKIFELGCGPGNISRYMLNKRADYQWFGIDIAPNMVDLAKANNPTATFAVMDCREVGQVNRKYDAILCGFCAPYLSKRDVEILISNARKLLHAGGIFHLSAMEDADTRSGLETSSAGDQVYIYYHQFEHIKKHLELNGFEILRVLRKAFPCTSAKPTTDMFIYARAI